MPDDKKENPELLKKYAPPELDEGDKKIAKKRAKKHGIPQEVAEDGRRQEKNVLTVQQLTNEYNSKLNDLGFVLEAVLKFDPKGIKPGFDLRPMNGAEMAFFKGKKAQEVAEAEKAANGEVKPEEVGKQEEQAKEETGPVEPLDVPKAA